MDTQNKGKTLVAFALTMIGAYCGSSGVQSILFDNPTSVSWILLFGGVGFVVLGTIIGLTDLMDKTAHEVVEVVEDGFMDDLENLQQGIMTWPIWQLIFSSAASVVYSYLLLRYHKFEAVWHVGPIEIPVWILTIMGIGIMAFIVTKTDWFNDIHFDTPAYVFIIAIVAFALSQFLGINRTENPRLLNPSYQAESSNYNYYHTNYYFFNGGSGGSSYSEFDMPECSGKSCEGMGYAICFILFIIFVLILVIGSAVFANFWIFSGGIFIGMMWLLTIQAVMVRPVRRYRSSYS